MKIIFDNIIFSLQKAGGISVVWQNLIENLLDWNIDMKCLEYPNVQANIFRSNFNIPASKIVLLNKFHNILSQFQHPKIQSQNNFIFHSSYFRICKNQKAINVTTVHDFIYEQSKPTLKQKIRMHLNYRAIRNSQAVVCISENTKKDLFKYIPTISSENVYVIHNGVSESYYPLTTKPYPNYKEYVLFVGGRQGYKNFNFVIDALSDTKYKLLICGSSLTKGEIEILESRLQNRYKHIYYPSTEELNKIYNSVFALAYPSSYEGFGIPFLEAQRSGCPVIALNASSITEIAGPKGWLLPYLDKQLFVSMLDQLKNEGKRESIINEGLINSQRFSWEKMAKEYLMLYNKLLSRS